MSGPEGRRRAQPAPVPFGQPPPGLSPMGHFNGIGGGIVWKAASATEAATVFVILVFWGPWPVPLGKVPGLRHAIQAYVVYLTIHLNGHGTDGAVTGIAGLVLCGCWKGQVREAGDRLARYLGHGLQSRQGCSMCGLGRSVFGSRVWVLLRCYTRQAEQQVMGGFRESW